MRNDMRAAILEAARPMVQARGYNALSFRDVAKTVGIKSASVHYHFPTKGDLGAALARRYTDDGSAYLEGLLDTDEDASALIRQFTGVFRSALINDNRMCLCGIMAAEHEDLPAEVRLEVDRFTDTCVRWLQQALSRGTRKRPDDVLRREALAIFAAVEGAQLVARGRRDIAVFDTILETYQSSGLLP